MSKLFANEETDAHILNLKTMHKNENFLKAYENLKIPPPSLNGGLYTGEPFREGSSHANIPIIPETGYINHYVMRGANPPTESLYQYPGGFRPGNNNPIMPGVQPYKDGKYGIMCQTAPQKPTISKKCNCPKCNCHKYYYL
jgi:hypothetical protein